MKREGRGRCFWQRTFRRLVQRGWVEASRAQAVSNRLVVRGRGVSELPGDVLNFEAIFSRGELSGKPQSLPACDLQAGVLEAAHALRFNGRISAGYCRGELLGTSIFEYFPSAEVEQAGFQAVSPNEPSNTVQ